MPAIQMYLHRDVHLSQDIAKKMDWVAMKAEDFVRIHARHDRRLSTLHDQLNGAELERLIEFRSGSAPRAESDHGRPPVPMSQPCLWPSAADPAR
jgi:hypothetical protein